MTKGEIKKRVSAALTRLVATDSTLLEHNASERAIAGALATHLGALFPDYHVDVEYNLHGLDRKALDLPPTCRGGGRRMVIPDIVVHRRGVDEHNLLAVEMKKETNKQSRDCDRSKLRGMLQQLHYQAAVFLDLPAGPGAATRKAKVEWY